MAVLVVSGCVDDVVVEHPDDDDDDDDDKGVPQVMMNA